MKNEEKWAQFLWSFGPRADSQNPAKSLSDTLCRNHGIEISMPEAASVLYWHRPAAFDSLAFQWLGNGYGDAAPSLAKRVMENNHISR